MIAAPDLLDMFRTALPPDIEAGDDAGPRLSALYTAGQAAWPALHVDARAFARHLASLARPGSPLPDLDFAADMFLATAAALSVAGAARALEQAHAKDIARAAARAGGSSSFVEDAGQAVWEKLLVGAAGSPPKIGEYAGHAPLKSFLRTVALRVALNLRRRKDEASHDTPGDDDAALGLSVDPELGYLMSKYKPEIEQAVRDALGALPARERAILRLHLEHRMSVDALGAHYGVGRSTAARWLKSARDAVAERTREGLHAKLGVSPAELGSILRLVQSTLEVSVLRILAAEHR
ncbi:MAG: sigma-70 family RNA polymerase sigma factor [Byssovorax sp.]